MENTNEKTPDGFKKIDKSSGFRLIKRHCRHPEHNPPSHIYLKPGEYVYTCPGCGEQTRVIVPEITC